MGMEWAWYGYGHGMGMGWVWDGHRKDIAPTCHRSYSRGTAEVQQRCYGTKYSMGAVLYDGQLHATVLVALDGKRALLWIV